MKSSCQENKTVLEFLMPGVEKEDVEILIDGNLISVSSKKETFFGEKIKYKTKILNQLHSDKKLLVEETTASLKNGVLKIEIPFKKTVSKTPKSITIE